MSRILRRVLLVIPTIWGAVTLVFLVAHLAPGGPARSLLGEKATPEALQAVRARYGWDAPLPLRYLHFLDKTFIRFDLGESYFSGLTVREEIKLRFPATAELTLAAMALALLAGLTAGVLASLHPGRKFDTFCTGISTIGVSVPVFFLGLLFLLFFRFLPMGDRLDLALDVEPITGLLVIDSLLQGQLGASWDALLHLVLPAITLSTIPMAIIARMTRTSMLEVLQSDYIRAARAKGLSERDVILRHALPNAAMPILTITGLQFGYLLAGAVLTETIFNWPGLGTYLTDAINNRDFNAIQGATIVIVCSFIILNLAVDLTYLWLRPRLRDAG